MGITFTHTAYQAGCEVRETSEAIGEYQACGSWQLADCRLSVGYIV